MDLGTMRQVIDGKRYDTAKATVLASDVYWDGSNWERGGRNTWLLRTPNGRYFFAHRTMWQGESDHLAPCDEAEARDFFEGMTERDTTTMDFEEAFPDAVIEEA